ncbi:MAG: DUF6273 domain-containing protein [Peptococcia bacterium]|jgi:hypothetical protein
MTRHINLTSIILLIIGITLVFSGCGLVRKINKPEEIRDIAYDVNKNHGYTVYLEENAKFVPYLVLTDDYNGNVLLLREHILNEVMIFNPNRGYNGYYENCVIDKFLNEEFMNSFTPEVQKQIIDSKIVITAKSSLGSCGKETTEINRKIFLLSHTELGLREHAGAAVEGKALKYFPNSMSRIAYLETGIAASWWLRTSYTEFHTTAWAVAFDAVTGGHCVEHTSGVRPAFCIDGKTLIETSDDVIKGETVYVLKL